MSGPDYPDTMSADADTMAAPQPRGRRFDRWALALALAGALAVQSVSGPIWAVVFGMSFFVVVTGLFALWRRRGAALSGHTSRLGA